MTMSFEKKRIWKIAGLVFVVLFLGPCVRKNLLHFGRYVAPIRFENIESLPESQPLIEAVGKQNIEEVKQLLDSGVSPNAISHVEPSSSSSENHPRTALMDAASIGDVEIVHLLLDRGADVNVRAYWGSNALLDAAFCGHPDVVKLLIERGADVDADDDGATALGYVSNFLSTTDVTTQEIYIKNAEDRHRYEEVARLLEGAGAHEWPFPF